MLQLPYDIELTLTVQKQLASLPKQERERILLKIKQYAQKPESLVNQVIRLKGSPYFRLRVGNYRVVFHIEGALMVIIRGEAHALTNH